MPSPRLRLVVILLAICTPALALATEVVVERDAGSGRVYGLRPAPERPVRSGGDPEAAAIDFLRTHGELVGLADPAAHLVPSVRRQDRQGNVHLRFRQEHRGVPVSGAEVLAHFDAAGRLTLVTAWVEPAPPADVTPRLDAFEARVRALHDAAWPRVRDLPSRALEPELRIVPAAATPDGSGARLAWRVVVTDAATGGELAGEAVFVDAADGRVVMIEPMIHHLTRWVMDCGGSDDLGPCVMGYVDSTFVPPYTLGRAEGSPPVGPYPTGQGHEILWGSPDVDNTYDYLGAIHELVGLAFGLDGANNQGGTSLGGGALPVEITRGWNHMDFWSSEMCPGGAYASDVTGTVGFCVGMAVKDVVGHEYGHTLALHGVPYSGMNYHGESGAIEEGFCDVFGEYAEFFIDGEQGPDWLGCAHCDGGSLRDLAEPSNQSSPTSGAPYPERYLSQDFYCGGGDYAGVHVNSTVISHAFYLFAEGGEHNGCWIEGQGIDTAAEVFHHALRHYFGTHTDFNQAYVLLQDACDDLYGPAACEQLRWALQSVEIDQAPGPCDGGIEVAPPCAVAHGGEIATARADGVPTTLFGVGQEVWLSVTDATADREFDVYVLAGDPERANWISLVDYALDQTAVTVDGEGSLLAPVFVTAAEGQFDLVLDGNRDGHWQPWADELVGYEVSAAVAVEDSPVPASTDLLQGIYPNPFNPRTDVFFFARPGDEVAVTVYDVAGRQVAVLHEGAARGGRQRVSWDATGFSSGVYLVQVTCGAETMTEKVALLK